MIGNPGTKYMIARIEIPVEIMPDGSHVNHNNRVSVNFYKCDYLPPIQNHEGIDIEDILENIFSNADEEPEFIVSKNIDENLDGDDENLDDDITEEYVEDDIDDDDITEEYVEDATQNSDSSTNEQEYFISKAEINSKELREPAKNISFKRHFFHKKHNITAKRRL